MINKYKQIVYFIVLIVIATGYGQSIQDLQKLKSEYGKFQKGQNQLQLPTGVDGGIDPTTGLPRQAQITPYQPIEIADEMEDPELEHFGYDFFTRRDTVAFWENLPTPANYMLGPGDELVISLWGETQLRETYTISRDGKVYDEKVGLLNLTGKSINEARQYLKDQYGRVYATLNGKTPSTFMDVSLGELRSINVNFVGEVKYPGVYPIHPFSTVITGLIQAGGVDITGSLRTIQIKRDGSIEETVDLYNYFINGEISSNIQLRDQDIVVIPIRKSTVVIDSAIVNPGIYEGVSGESVFDLIQYAGGLKTDAADKIGLSRIKAMGKRSSEGVYEGHYINIENAKLIPIQDGDEILVRRVFEEKLLVEIIGQVKVPGVYHYYEGMTFQDLFLLGGGVNDSTFWKSVYHDQAEIIRRDPESRYENVIKVSLADIYNDNGGKDILLQNLDRVVIHANLNYFEKDNIHISGEVKIPGAYPLTSDKETLQSLLRRAGNTTSKALKNGISIYRDKKYFEVIRTVNFIAIKDTDGINAAGSFLKKGTDKVRVAWQNESITLMPGDSIVVKESTGTVNVYGEVYNPGLIEYREGVSLRKYLNAAGGLTERGNRKSVIVVYANGLVSPKRWYSNPRIEDGVTIIVNEKKIDEPLDITQLVSNWTSIIASMITAVILTRQI